MLTQDQIDEWEVSDIRKTMKEVMVKIISTDYDTDTPVALSGPVYDFYLEKYGDSWIISHNVVRQPQ